MVVIFEREPPAPDFFMPLRREVHRKLIYTTPENFPVELVLDGSGSVIRGATSLLREQFFATGNALDEWLAPRLP